MPSITIPDVPESWQKALDTLLKVAILGYMLWTNNKPENIFTKVDAAHAETVSEVKEVKKEATDAKAEAAANKEIIQRHSNKVENKLDSIDKKTDAVKSALPPKKGAPEKDDDK